MPNHALNDTEMSSQTIYLHSTDAVISLTDAEKVFYLEQNIQAPAGYRLLIGLTNMTLPNTMYNVTSDSNQIVIAGVTYTIPVGNYNAETLADEITLQIAAIGSCGFDEGANDSNNIFKFTFTSPRIINTMTMKRQLGFRNADFPLTSSSIVTAPQVCDCGGVTNIYVNMRNLTINNLDSRGRNTSIISSIVNNTNYGGYIFYTPPEVLYYMIAENTISHLDIELTDQEGDIIDLNGSSYNMTFTIHYVKQRESMRKEGLLANIRKAYANKQHEKEKEKSNEN